MDVAGAELRGLNLSRVFWISPAYVESVTRTRTVLLARSDCMAHICVELWKVETSTNFWCKQCLEPKILDVTLF